MKKAYLEFVVGLFLAIGIGCLAWLSMKLARKEIEQAIKLNPLFADAHYNMAQLLLAVQPPEPIMARAHYERALELGGDPDPDFEIVLRKAVLMWKAAEMAKKHLVTRSRGQNDSVSEGKVIRDIPIEQGQPGAIGTGK